MPGRLARLIGLTAALAVLLSACASSEFAYVSSSDRNAYFKIPSDWRFFDKKDILVASGQSLSAETDRQLSWLIAFDADPKPSLHHVVNIAEAPKHPVIMARVEALPFSVRDQISLRMLRNLIYPLDQLENANKAEVLSFEDVVLEGGLRGNRLTYDIALQGFSNVADLSGVIRVTQIVVIDPATTKLYMFVIRCESHCYRDNKTLLDQIADSWTVKER
ncbi:MAG: hypothetical protein ACRDHO_11190 [Actinomycetota bacterium]